MERLRAWQKIRDTIPGSFYTIVKATNLEREIRLSKPDLKGQFNFTPFTELERHNQEIQQLDDALQIERDISRRKQTEFSQRWALAYERHQDLDHVLHLFDRYYQESQSKVRHDQDRRAQYFSESKELDREIRKLGKELQYLAKVKVTIETRRDLCERYKDYLQSVVMAYNRSETLVKGDEPYSKIPDLLGRFEHLRNIRDNKSTEVVTNLTRCASSLVLEDKEKDRFHHEEQAYRTYSKKMVDYTDKLQVYVGNLNENLIKVKKQNHAHILGAERPKMNIYSLYCNLAKEMRQEIKLKESDVTGQLRFIQKFLGEMKKISARVREHLQVGSEVPLPSSHEQAIQRTSVRSSV